jgi:CheY-like chemotaxis protein
MESIGTLAGGIAHDFNNILSGIFGYTEISMMDVERESTAYNNLHEVLKAGGRAKDLVSQILAFSRQSDSKPKPVQVKLITKEALKLLRATLPTTIEIHQNLKSNSVAMADPTQLHQVIMNLCTNAGSAMYEKGGELSVNIVDVDIDSEFVDRPFDVEPGTYIKISVSDTGHGISPEIMELIFDPFFTTKGTGEGTGMGLSVVHGIIKSLGGAITVDSELEKGSTFELYIPAIESEAVLEPESAVPLPVGTERILFVDDEELLVDLGKQMLERLGYKVVTRTNSLEALELFRANPNEFDLVITDMTMPNLTGDKLAAELLKMKPNIPIILCTGFSSTIDEHKAKAIGIRAFVYKPILKKDIATAIRKVLDEKQ